MTSTRSRTSDVHRPSTRSRTSAVRGPSTRSRTQWRPQAVQAEGVGKFTGETAGKGTGALREVDTVTRGVATVCVCTTAHRSSFAHGSPRAVLPPRPRHAAACSSDARAV